jgi:predicted Zn finger-like uncharacterized protein
MILTCPACGTKYVVKDGAIPAGGRQVRCAACKHSWHQEPEGEAAAEAAGALEDSTTVDAPLAQAPTESLPPVSPEAEVEAAVDDQLDVAASPPEQIGDSEPAMPPERDQWAPAPEGEAAALDQETAAADDFDPFYDHEPIERPRRRVPLLAWLLLAVAAAAIAFWFLAPDELRQRLGIAGPGETPLEVMVTNSDRQRLASGNELFAVSGRVINPTDRTQRVPPLRAELLDASGSRVIYSWTIAPPAPTLAAGSSAPFNSAEIDVPQGGSHLRVTLGDPAA